MKLLLCGVLRVLYERQKYEVVMTWRFVSIVGKI